MESHGLPGEIQVSARTKELLASSYVLEERDTIEVKGKGPMKTWLLRGRKDGQCFEVLKVRRICKSFGSFIPYLVAKEVLKNKAFDEI